MKVLTAQQMGEVDRKTIDTGIPSLQLMEHAATAVVDYLEARFAPLSAQRILVVCGKGNNGGDGLAIARQLLRRFEPAALHVVLAADPASLTGDAATNLQRLIEADLTPVRHFHPDWAGTTLLIDAVLGTGLRGPATGEALEAINHINTAFPHAKVVAVDIPSGLSGDSGNPPGDYVRADATVTFTAPKICHAMPPACNLMGELVIAPIGSPAGLYEGDPALTLELLTPAMLAPLFAPRPRGANKGTFGHVLLAGGSPGKPGAPAMAGIAALRAGAGLVTVACPTSIQPQVSGFYPELMTEPADDIDGAVEELAKNRTVIAIGPGLGTTPATIQQVCRLFDSVPKPLVLDADALNCLAQRGSFRAAGHLRVLTPHPGEMSRLTGLSIAQIQSDRLATASRFATERNVTLVLKGERTLIAFPDGRLWINPTGSPAMATGGTGDILTGMIAGMLAQFPGQPEQAIAAAVYLHGLSGELAARALTEQCVIATDLLHYLPEAIRAITALHHQN